MGSLACPPRCGEAVTAGPRAGSGRLHEDGQRLKSEVDAVVIGAGPNGLVAANLLADAGWSVVVLEAEQETRRSGPLGRDVRAGVHPRPLLVVISVLRDVRAVAAIRTRVLAKAGAMGLGLLTKAMPDTPAKLAGLAYAYETFEIASYRMLRKVAEIAEDAERLSMCDRIIPVEQQAARERQQVVVTRLPCRVGTRR